MVESHDGALGNDVFGGIAIGQAIGSIIAVDVIPHAEKGHEVRTSLQVEIAEVDVVACDGELGVEGVYMVIVDAVVEVDALKTENQAVVWDAIDDGLGKLPFVVAPPRVAWDIEHGTVV